MTKITLVLVYGLALGASVICVSALAQPTLPDFSAATFVPGQPIDNQYFPLTEGLKRIYEGELIDGNETATERFKLKTLGPGPIILGVQTIAQRDRSFEDNVLVEDTLDYYAQDTAGNVWYFGEDVTNFLYDDMGNPAGTNSDGSWRAGVNDGLPGFIMPADLTIGFNYYQEFAPMDDALDEGTTIAVDEMVSTDLDNYTNVLKVLEATALEPDFMELKYYAPGRGLVFVEEGVNADLMDPELTFELVRVKAKSDGEGTDGDGTSADVTGAVVTGVDDTGVDDTGVDDTGVDDTGVDDTGVDDTGVDDTGVDVTGVDVTGVDVTIVDVTGVDGTDDDSLEDREKDGNLESGVIEKIDAGEMDVNADHAETAEVNMNEGDDSRSALAASDQSQLFLAYSPAVSALSYESELTTIIDQAVNAASSSDVATLSVQMDSGVLASTTIFEDSEPYFPATKRLAVGISAAGGARSSSGVPEPSTLLLIALALLATCACRSRPIS